MLADGYTPRYEKKVDPGAGAISVKIEPLGPAPEDKGRVLRGRLVDDRGEPVAGAIVSAVSVHREKDGFGRYGSIDGLDPYAISDAKGVFRVCHKEAVDRIGVEIRAPGLAPRSVELRTGGEARKVALDPGATVTGQLLLDGKGVGGIVMGLVQTDRGVGKFLGETTIGTDEDGRFVFNNVARGFEYAVYGKMNSLRDHGATQPRIVKIDNPSVEIGAITVHRGFTVSGRVVTTDGKPIPEEIRALLSAEVAWDSQLAILDKKGGFAFRGVPRGLYGFTVRVPGYRLSARNRSRLPTRPGSMEGRIVADIQDLVIELEPGKTEWPRGTRELWEQQQKIRDAPLRGVLRK